MLHAILSIVFAAALIYQVVPRDQLLLSISHEDLIPSSKQGQDPNVDYIFFYHYPDPSDPSIRKRIQLSDPSSIEKAQLTRNTGAKFVIHGVLGACDSTDFPLPAVKEYLKSKQNGKGNYNVICVEYTTFTLPNNTITPPGLINGAKYTLKFVGEETAKVIKVLKDNQIISDYKSVHLIGHSLGTHVCGSTGYQLNLLTNNLVGRISGLDPGHVTWPIIGGITDKKLLLDTTDAVFVDGYHTSWLLGDIKRLGHIDFYPDGGMEQESCRNSSKFGIEIQGYAKQKEWIGFCSHKIVGFYWAKSINDKVLLEACEAEDWADYKRLKNEGICQNPVVFGEKTLHPHSRYERKYYLDHPIIDVPDAAKNLFKHL